MSICLAGSKNGAFLFGLLTLSFLASPLFAEITANESAVVELARNHGEQGRPELICDSILFEAAQQRADDLLNRNYFSHTNPDGFGPNHLVESLGYQLPNFYGQEADANNIESIYSSSGFIATGEEAFDSWLNSPGHRAHLLAEIEFYAEQIRVGVGFASDGNRAVYVFLSAPDTGFTGEAIACHEGSEGSAPGEGGEPRVVEDTWTEYYDIARDQYDSNIGADPYFALAQYYYYVAAGDYYYYLDSEEDTATATYKWWENTGLYFLYLNEGDDTGFYYYYIYVANGLYYFYLTLDDPVRAGEQFNYYFDLAESLL